MLSSYQQYEGGWTAIVLEKPPGGYYCCPSDEAILRFMALSDEEKLQWAWEMNELLADAPPETRKLHEMFRRGEI